MAVMGAVIMLPLCMLAMAAVEFHHVTTVRSALQKALDAATLAAAKTGKKTPPELKAAGLPVLRANLMRHASSGGLKEEDVHFHPQAEAIAGEATLCVKTIVSSVLGREQTCLVVQSQAVRESSYLEVVLVLDSSASMETYSPSAGMKRIEALEAAAKGFITSLEDLDDESIDDDVKIGVVPYAGSVKLDPVSSRGKPWLDEGGVSSLNTNLFYDFDIHMQAGNPSTPVARAYVSRPNRIALFDQMGTPWLGCVESRPGDYAVNDTAPTTAQPDSLFVPYFAPDELDRNDVQTTSYPNNYLDDGLTRDFSVRGQNKKMSPIELADLYRYHWQRIQYGIDKYATGVGAALGTRTDLGPNRWCVTDRVIPLTGDDGFAAMRTSLDVIPTGRHTNIPMGLVWGWHVLSPNAPFGTAKAYDQKGVRKVLVLLTDGHSYIDPPGTNEDVPNRNQSYYDGVGYLWRGSLGITSGTHADQLAVLSTRMNTLCTRMKAKGVVIYTIQLEMGITENSALSACSGEDNFKNANQASELNQIFQEIASEISQSRIKS